MEVDWEVEIGPDLPVIDVGWDGFVDLRNFPERIAAIEEAGRHPAIREALLALNDSDSPVFTAKCDYWVLNGAEIDSDEFAARRETARIGIASYIDVVEREPDRFASLELQEQRARAITASLGAHNLRQGRVDLVLRSAVVGGRDGFGLTLYAAGCGASEADAYAAWESVLAAAAAATIAGAAQSHARASSSIG